MRRNEAQAVERQKDCADGLVRNCKESLDDFELLPGHLIAAEESLDQAEARFREGAFAPFWDCIEQAVQELGGFDTRVQSITSRLTTYDTLVKQYEGQPPQFPIDRDRVATPGRQRKNGGATEVDSLQGSMQLRIRHNL